ncbi:hypothetical protein ATANTOWER_032967 [Ataeniobius toweri]|uniref:Uncharacterized protein n=1 Tax=Ataeniobius toweri TaxID=208326 RepID=A0ABU7A4D0_9TELE|nr:hypothetical protein [Ataeniobius toweri]
MAQQAEEAITWRRLSGGIGSSQNEVITLGETAVSRDMSSPEQEQARSVIQLCPEGWHPAAHQSLLGVGT